jgi:hypothetical protein
MTLDPSGTDDDTAERLRKGPRLDPAGPAFWDVRYREGFTPWEMRGIPASLSRFLAAERRSLRVLVPGCGSAQEVSAFADAGHEVVAIDFSEVAVASARAALGERAHLVKQADFFEADLGEPFDLVYDRAFLCALPRSWWQRYAARVVHVLRADGRLAGFFFFDTSDRGPPFGLREGELETLLSPRLRRIEDCAVEDSIAVFAGRERWQVWRRDGPLAAE